MRWSQLKKRIEATFADSVRGRVEVWNTGYRKATWKEGEVWITIDKKKIYSIGSYTYWMKIYHEAEVLRKDRGCTDPNGPGYWETYEEIRETMPDKGVMPRWEAIQALYEYLNMSIDDVLETDHPVIRAVGMLDKRLGKRRLRSIDPQEEHSLVKILYDFRCKSEGISRNEQQIPRDQHDKGAPPVQEIS